MYEHKIILTVKRRTFFLRIVDLTKNKLAEVSVKFLLKKSYIR